jgi:hypothetical protein
MMIPDNGGARHAEREEWYHGRERSSRRVEILSDEHARKTRGRTGISRSIMITFNGSALRSLRRRTSDFYMYSMRRGVSVKPWFILPDSRLDAEIGERGGPGSASAVAQVERVVLLCLTCVGQVDSLALS